MQLLSVGIEADYSEITPSNHAKLMREVMYDGGRHHRLANIPKHFQINSDTAPGGAYGYAKRSKKYMLMKARRFHTQQPLVATGKMRAEAIFNSAVTATQHKTQIRIRNYFPMKVQRRKELEAVSPEEVDEMADRMKANYLRLSRGAEFRRQRKQKSR